MASLRIIFLETKVYFLDDNKLNPRLMTIFEW